MPGHRPQGILTPSPPAPHFTSTQVLKPVLAKGEDMEKKAMPALLQKVGSTQQEAHALIEVDWTGKKLTADDAGVIAWMLRNGKLATATSLKYLPLRLNLLENCRGHDIEPAPERLLLCQRPLTVLRTQPHPLLFQSPGQQHWWVL